MKVLAAVLIFFSVTAHAEFVSFRGIDYQCKLQTSNLEVLDCEFDRPAYIQLKTGAQIEATGLARDGKNLNTLVKVYGDGTTPFLKVSDSERKFKFTNLTALQFNENDEVTSGYLWSTLSAKSTRSERVIKLNRTKFKDGYAYSDYESETPTISTPSIGDLYLQTSGNVDPKVGVDRYCRSLGYDTWATASWFNRTPIYSRSYVYDLPSKSFKPLRKGVYNLLPLRLQGAYMDIKCGMNDLSVKL